MKQEAAERSLRAADKAERTKNNVPNIPSNTPKYAMDTPPGTPRNKRRTTPAIPKNTRQRVR